VQAATIDADTVHVASPLPLEIAFRLLNIRMTPATSSTSPNAATTCLVLGSLKVSKLISAVSKPPQNKTAASTLRFMSVCILISLLNHDDGVLFTKHCVRAPDCRCRPNESRTFVWTKSIDYRSVFTRSASRDFVRYAFAPALIAAVFRSGSS